MIDQNNKMNFETLFTKLKDKVKNESGILTETLMKNMDDTKNLLNCDVLNILLTGGFSSGKSTLINTLVSIMTNKSKNVRLPVSECENTYYQTVIEASPDEQYHLIISRSNKVNQETKSTNPEDINKELKILDKKSTENIKKLKQKESLEEMIITIRIPNFPKHLRLIDSPGLTTGKMKSQIFKLLDSNYLFSVIVYLKDLKELSENENVYTFFNEIQKKNNDSQFCVCFNKYDKLFSEYYTGSQYFTPDEDEEVTQTKTNELRKFTQNFTSFKGDLIERSKNLNISRIFINNNLGKTEHSKSQLNKFVNYINYLYVEKGEEIKKSCFITQFSYLLELIKCNLTSSDFEDCFKNIVLKASQIYCEQLVKWREHFNENLNSSVVNDIVNISNSHIKDESSVYKHSYIKTITEGLLSIYKRKINDNLNEILVNHVQNFEYSMLDLFNNHSNNFLKVNVDSLDSRSIELLKIGLRSISTGIISSIQSQSSYGISYGILSVIKILISFLSEFTNNIGVWSREGCNDEIKEKFCRKLSEEVPKIIEFYKCNFKTAIDQFQNNLKKTVEEVKKIIEPFEEYKAFMTKEDKIEINEVFQNGDKEFDENESVKEFIKELFLNDGKKFFE
jgi:predicted GTPase